MNTPTGIKSAINEFQYVQPQEVLQQGQGIESAPGEATDVSGSLDVHLDKLPAAEGCPEGGRADAAGRSCFLRIPMPSASSVHGPSTISALFQPSTRSSLPVTEAHSPPLNLMFRA